tara:strand:+ start:216 stop:2090 length:1875 start_codon:yes stop_codon:yes gene_type:complete
MFDFEYKKNIQFLRGLSVIFVFLYHTNISFFERGYLGVDIFFVISGFVITQRIFQNYEIEKKISLKDFYSKRLKRIIPNLFFIVGFTFVFYLLFGPPDLSLWNETLSALFGVSNFYYIIHDIGYFDNVFNDPLAHTWSLGVEEQFYLLYPLLIFLIFQFKNNKFLILQIVFFIIFLTSIFFYKIKLDTNPLIAFFLSPLRFWELIFGAILFLNSNRFKKNNLISIFSLLLIIFLIFTNFDYDYFLLNFIIVLLSGSFIIFFSKSKFIENSAFVYFGNISYSFYLWHLPVLFFLDLYSVNKFYADVAFSFLITCILSITTYHYIEQKFRYLELKKLKKLIFVCSPLFLLIFGSLIYVKYFNETIRQDLRNFIYNVNYLNYKYSWSNRVPFNNLIHLDNKKIYDYCEDRSINFSKNSDGLKKECLRQKNYETLFFIEGNSHTAQFIPIFNKLKQLENVYYKHSVHHRISVIEVNELSSKFSEIIYVTNIGSKDKLNIIKENYPKFDNDIKFIFFKSTPYPENKYQPFKCLVQQIDCSIDKSKDFEKRSLDNLFKEIEIFKKKNDNIFLFDSYEALCPGEKCKIYDKNKDLLFYRDASHLVVEGSETLTQKFNDFIRSLQKDQLILK